VTKHVFANFTSLKMKYIPEIIFNSIVYK